ncbi:hypothetical protein NYA28ABAC_03876 (plasmid) [Salinicola sp. NYA28a]
MDNAMSVAVMGATLLIFTGSFVFSAWRYSRRQDRKQH